ncbi:MAG: hypothetical protein ACLFPS_07745 [Clostridia bacterium]
MNKDVTLTTKEILKFYLPLAAAAFIMMGSNNIVNFALNKTENAQAALAAFTVAFSYAETIAAPCFSAISMYITLGKDRVYFLNTLKFTFKILLVATFIISLFAFTPIGEYIAVTFGGVTKAMLKEVKDVWKLTIFLPLIYLSISTSRAVLLIEQSTIYVTISRMIRLILMLIFAMIVPRFNLIQGAAVGAVVMLAGMTVEVFANAIPAYSKFKKWPKTPDETVHKKRYPPTQKSALKFLTPLIVTSLMWGLGRPILYSGLARMTNPELTIATYRVATSFVWLYIVFVEDNVKQITVAFLSKYTDQAKKLIKFSSLVCAFVVIAILLSIITPFGKLVLEKAIGVNQEMANLSILPILILALFPIIQTVLEYHASYLLIEGRTNPLGFAKVINIITMSITIFILAITSPHLGATAGAIALTTGFISEMIIIRHYAKKVMPISD